MTRKRSSSTDRRELKSTPIFVTKVDEGQGLVEAVVSVFGVLDYGRDIIWPGAFAKTITERFNTIKVVDQHNTDSIFRVLGKPLELREIGRDELPPQVLERFPTATGGLLTQTQYDMDTPEGLGAFNRIKSGSINEYSIGYEAVDSDRQVLEIDGKRVNVRNIRQIKLWEFSPVIWGMNPATTTVDAKEMTDDGPVARFGDYLHGELLRTAHYCLDDRYAYGFFDKDEFDRLSSLVETQLDALRGAMPEDLALRPLWSFGSLLYDALTGADEDTKAGRVLSTVNAEKIRSAYDKLTEVLKSAGVLADPTEETPPDDEDEAKSEEPLAGPPNEAPTRHPVEQLKLRAQALERRLTLGEQS